MYDVIHGVNRDVRGWCPVGWDEDGTGEVDAGTETDERGGCKLVEGVPNGVKVGAAHVFAASGVAMSMIDGESEHPGVTGVVGGGVVPILDVVDPDA